ncbi:Spermidine/putrescine import ATP-binding protein PotA [compost metagenome]
MHMSDGIAVLNHGRVEQYDTGHHLYRKPGSRFVADFIGKSNIFEGALSQGSSGSRFVAAEFKLAGVDLNSATDRIGKAELVVRPEDIRLDSLAGAAISVGDIVLSGVVATSTYSGDRVLYTVSLPNGRTITTYGSARDGALSTDTPVQIAFDAKDCILLN